MDCTRVWAAWRTRQEREISAPAGAATSEVEHTGSSCGEVIGNAAGVAAAAAAENPRGQVREAKSELSRQEAQRAQEGQGEEESHANWDRVEHKVRA